LKLCELVLRTAVGLSDESPAIIVRSRADGTFTFDRDHAGTDARRTRRPRSPARLFLTVARPHRFPRTAQRRHRACADGKLISATAAAQKLHFNLLARVAYYCRSVSLSGEHRPRRTKKVFARRRSSTHGRVLCFPRSCLDYMRVIVGR